MSHEVPRPTNNDDRDAWKAYWAAQGMPWRTEPEIDEERQAYLAEQRAITAHIARGAYPFKDVEPKLTRDDIEWLLATHESGGSFGPVEWNDPRQREREGLDLRGAELTGVDLAHLPLARVLGGLTYEEWLGATSEQTHHAMMHVGRANFTGAHLEGARLGGVNFSGTYLRLAHLEEADLDGAVFDEHSSLNGAHLNRAILDVVIFNGTNLAVINWQEVRRLGDEVRARMWPAATSTWKQRASQADRYLVATRTYRALAVMLRAQGLTEDADRFTYRGHLCRRQALRRQGLSLMPAYMGSLLLAMLSGYGYRLWRILAAYATVLVVFTVSFWLLGVHSFAHEPSIRALWDSFLVSLSAVHGRTSFEQLGAWSPAAWVAAVESVVGIVIEGVFVAMLIQRFFAR
jgi:hypothetical protein